MPNNVRTCVSLLEMVKMLVLLLVGSGSPGEHLVPPPPPTDLRDVGAGEHHGDKLHNGKQHNDSRIN